MMITRQRKRSFVQRIWLPLLSVGLLGYFGYHTFHGDFGIWARERLIADGERLQVERDRLVAERTALETRIASVRPDSLDVDVIDMQARRALGYMREDEVVIHLGAVQQ